MGAHPFQHGTQARNGQRLKLDLDQQSNFNVSSAATWRWLVAVLICTAVLATFPAHTHCVRIGVIGSDPVQIGRLDRLQLRNLYLLKTHRVGQRRLQLAAFAPGLPEFDDFAAALGVAPYVIRRWWDEARYSGLADVPELTTSTAGAIRWVRSESNRIAVVSLPDCTNLCAEQLIWTACQQSQAT